jgi:hypothetical protein
MDAVIEKIKECIDNLEKNEKILNTTIPEDFKKFFPYIYNSRNEYERLITGHKSLLQNIEHHIDFYNRNMK